MSQRGLMLFAYRKNTQEAVHVEEVARGGACECVCIICGEELIAKKGNIKQHHFSHNFEANCSAESALHKLCKQIIKNSKEFMLPAPKGKFFYFCEPLLEQKMGDIKPDVVIENEEGIKWLIEIKVTHAVDDKKRKKIERERYNVVEIEAKAIYDEVTSIKELEDALINGVKHKKIIPWDNNNPEHNSKDSSLIKWIIGLAVV
ncbi:MAG: hypothetical protein EBX41_07155, partial [Chitinophagia bacterium]|nr:hypothetical protein [Chitinophagia bacterium]